MFRTISLYMYELFGATLLGFREDRSSYAVPQPSGSVLALARFGFERGSEEGIKRHSGIRECTLSAFGCLVFVGALCLLGCLMDYGALAFAGCLRFDGSLCFSG